MKSLLIYLKNYKKESILAPLFKLLEASFELIVPLVVASIIDDGIKLNSKSVVFSRVGLLVVFAFVGMAFAITAQFFAAKAATGFGKEVRHSLFEKIQSLSFNELDKVGTSTLITRMTSDVNSTQGAVNLTLRLLLRSPFIVLGAVIMSMTIDLKASLIFIVAIILLTIVVYGITFVTMPKYKEIQNNFDKITLSTKENLDGVRVIRAFNEEKREMDFFKSKNDHLSHLQKQVGRVSALLNPVTYIIINLAIVYLINFCGYRVNSGTLSQGQVVALYNYMSQILVELIKLSVMIVTLTKGVACGNRIEDVFNLTNTLEHNNNSKNTKAFIEFDNVSLRYKNASQDSIKNVSFKVNKGDVIGIIGGTGSGKSTLVSLLPHFYDSTNGAVYINSKDVKSYSKEEINSLVSFCEQNPTLFSKTVRENMLVAKNDSTDEEIINVLKIAQIWQELELKEGLDTVVLKNATNFSGGQKQRLSIARALLKNSSILVFDDSFSALDYQTESKIRDSIYNLNDKTIFIVSQRASSVMNANKIIVLEDGECVGIGAHQELLKDNEIYREIYTSQFSEEVAQ